MGKLKLMIDSHCHRVLFAEADKESVDLLFQLLSLPVATVIKLQIRTQPDLLGSLTKLYNSVKNLDDKYIQAERSKDTLLSPKLALNGAPTQMSLYRCKSACHFSDDPHLVCPKCGEKMTQTMSYVGTRDPDEGGFVKGVVTYMVMDDLEVKPLSTMKIVSLLNEYGVQNLMEKDVNFGPEEAAKLFITTFKSRKKVLTNVYLKGMKQGTP